MNFEIIATSALVSALVGGGITFLTQRHLLSRKSKLDYELDAKRRLYLAIGPLRLQLLLAARDVVRRFQQHHGTAWNMAAEGYYVRSCIYRLLAPLAIGQLIERQMSFVDFSVDKDAVSLLRFITSAERMLTGNDIILEHPDTDWSTQSQHLFRDNLRSASSELIAQDPGEPARLLTFSEFSETYDVENRSLKPLIALFDRCEASLTENSIFWIRVVGYSYVCAKHIESKPAKSLGFSSRPMPLHVMVEASNDEYFISRLDEIKQALERTLNEGL